MPRVRLVFDWLDRRTIVVMTDGFAKQQAAVPATWIALALRRKHQFAADPEKYSFEGNR